MSPISNIHESAAHEKWQKLIDCQLIELEGDPGEMEDDEGPPPSSDTILLAIRVANRLRDSGTPAPTRIVPDAHGGIVIEREEDNLFESYRISADRSVEYCAFKDCRLVKRTPLSLTDH